MHFNIYLDDQTGQRLTEAAQQAGEHRNAVIRRAVQEWLARRQQPGVMRGTRFLSAACALTAAQLRGKAGTGTGLQTEQPQAQLMLARLVAQPALSLPSRAEQANTVADLCTCIHVLQGNSPPLLSMLKPPGQQLPLAPQLAVVKRQQALDLRSLEQQRT